MPGRATAPATSTTRTAPPADGAEDAGSSLETRSPAGSAIGGRGLIIAKNATATIAPSPIAPAATQASVLGRPTGERLEPVVAAVAAGTVRVRLAHRLRLDEAEEAHRLSQTGRLTGRVILVV